MAQQLCGQEEQVRALECVTGLLFEDLSPCRLQFTLFLWVLALNGLFGGYFNYQITKTVGLDTIMIIAIVLFVAFFLSGAYMLWHNVSVFTRSPFSVNA